MPRHLPHLERAAKRERPGPAIAQGKSLLRNLTVFFSLSDSLAKAVVAYESAHGLQALLDQLDSNQEAELRSLWPTLQAAEIGIPDLPAEE